MVFQRIHCTTVTQPTVWETVRLRSNDCLSYEPQVKHQHTLTVGYHRYKENFNTLDYVRLNKVSEFGLIFSKKNKQTAFCRQVVSQNYLLFLVPPYCTYSAGEIVGEGCVLWRAAASDSSFTNLLKCTIESQLNLWHGLIVCLEGTVTARQKGHLSLSAVRLEMVL